MEGAAGLSPEQWSILADLLGTPAGLAVVLYLLWVYGPGKTWNWLVESVRKIEKDFHSLLKNVEEDRELIRDVRRESMSQGRRLDRIERVLDLEE